MKAKTVKLYLISNLTKKTLNANSRLRRPLTSTSLRYLKIYHDYSTIFTHCTYVVTTFPRYQMLKFLILKKIPLQSLHLSLHAGCATARSTYGQMIEKWNSSRSLKRYKYMSAQKANVFVGTRSGTAVHPPLQSSPTTTSSSSSSSLSDYFDLQPSIVEIFGYRQTSTVVDHRFHCRTVGDRMSLDCATTSLCDDFQLSRPFRSRGSRQSPVTERTNGNVLSSAFIGVKGIVAY